jgi:hypothetical protein
VLAVVEVLGPGHRDPRLAPFRGELVGVVDMEVEPAAAGRSEVVRLREVDGQWAAVGEGVGLVVVRGTEAQPLVVINGPADIGVPQPKAVIRLPVGTTSRFCPTAIPGRPVCPGTPGSQPRQILLPVVALSA